jgi:hypothetical protein
MNRGSSTSLEPLFFVGVPSCQIDDARSTMPDRRCQIDDARSTMPDRRCQIDDARSTGAASIAWRTDRAAI